MFGTVLSFVLALLLRWIPLAVRLSLQLGWYLVRSVCGLTPRSAPRRKVSKEDFNVVVIGAGFSGLGIGIRLKEAGIPFVIVDRASEVGGTWYHNTYPGCACDIPSQLYSYSFEPNPNWSRAYPPQAEILEYLKGVADKYGLREHIRLNTNVNWDRWNEQTKLWEVNVNDDEVLYANVVINGAGALHVPNYPNIPGRDTFRGESFHTAKWDHSVDISGKRVGVIGSAASALQAIPEIAGTVSHLHVFQRTPNWVLPKQDPKISSSWKWLYRTFPFTMKVSRVLLYWRHALNLAVAFNPSTWTAKSIRKVTESYIRRCLRRKPELLEKLMPTYPMGCKRILLSNDYYRTLCRDNVTLVTSGIAAMEPEGIRTKDGELIELDVVVYATGFRVLDGLPKTYGRDEHDLLTEWTTSSSPEAFLGIAVPKFPNKFLLLGPHTGLGSNSVVWMIECQINYICAALTHQIDGGYRSMEVKPGAHSRFMSWVDEELESSVWASSNCNSWYQDKNGKIFALWPSYTFAYWWMTKCFDSSDFQLEK